MHPCKPQPMLRSPARSRTVQAAASGRRARSPKQQRQWRACQGGVLGRGAVWCV